MHQIEFRTHFNLQLKEIEGIVFDKDGILMDSEPHLIGNLFEGLREYLKLDFLPDSLITEARKTFGQTHLKVVRDFYSILNSNGYSIKESIDEWPDHYTNICTQNWQKLSKSGIIEKKPGVDQLFSKIREFKIPTAMYTGTVRPMAEVDIEYTLKAKDLFKDQFLITSDDERVTHVEKSEPDGWHLMAKEIEKTYSGKIENMIAFEDRASGAIGALKAGFKYLIIVPDKNDAPQGFDPNNFSSYWDKHNLIETHLKAAPRDIERIVFLNSLLQLTTS